ncbi:hypothetical protein [Lysinibacillus fusiformis]|uniref:hypothetical protein n=1 Tax=Lysinibacillus fusiformis TaxID=28031 RepID=UPI003CFD0488
MTTDAIDRVRSQALAVDPVKAVLFVVLLPFLLVGWAVRLVGYVLAFAWIAAKTGYGDAGGWLDERERRRKAAG